MPTHSSIKQLIEDAEYYSSQLVVGGERFYQAVLGASNCGVPEGRGDGGDLCSILKYLPALESLVLHEPDTSRCQDVDMDVQDRPHMIDEILCEYLVSTAVPNLKMLELVWGLGCEMSVDVALAIVEDEFRPGLDV